MSKTNGKRNGRAQQAGARDDGRDAKGHFLPGVSGNPTGSKAGYATKVRRQLQAILEEQTTDTETRSKLDILLRSVYAKAVKGDMVAAKLILDRIFPATLQADVNVSGMSAGRVLDVFDRMANHFVSMGELPDIVERN